MISTQLQIKDILIYPIPYVPIGPNSTSVRASGFFANFISTCTGTAHSWQICNQFRRQQQQQKTTDREGSNGINNTFVFRAFCKDQQHQHTAVSTYCNIQILSLDRPQTDTYSTATAMMPTKGSISISLYCC
jgi:hypothetical protein